MIWVIGGTSEGEYFSKRLGSIPHIVTLGTKEGLNFYKGENYKYNRMDGEEMKNFIVEENIHMAIDLSHPFAFNVSREAKKACEESGIEYLRFERNTTKLGKNTMQFSTYEECFKFLKDYQGTVLITTGSNRVEDFEKIRNDNRFIYRVLPMVESVTKLTKLGIHIKDIIAMVGPFTKDLDKEFYKFFNVDAVVMKDSGKSGGTDEKIQACEELGIKSFVITRFENTGETFEDFVDEIIEKIQKNFKN